MRVHGGREHGTSWSWGSVGPESNPRCPASNLGAGIPHQMLWFSASVEFTICVKAPGGHGCV